MDSTTLRVVLVILAFVFIAGIYLWDKRKHVDRRLGLKQTARKRGNYQEPSFNKDEAEAVSESYGVTEPSDEFDIVVKSPKEDDAESLAPNIEFSATSDDLFSFEKPQQDLSFSATSAFQEFEAGADLPTKIIQVHLLARQSDISGQMILDLANELNLELGEFNIFHRIDPKTGKSVFSMANIVEPGTFDEETMSTFKTPGLTLFSQLPAPQNCLDVFQELIEAAKRISFIVDADMQDSSKSTLTAQSIEHEKESVVEYQKQLKLAMQAL